MPIAHVELAAEVLYVVFHVKIFVLLIAVVVCPFTNRYNDFPIATLLFTEITTPLLPVTDTVFLLFIKIMSIKDDPKGSFFIP